jgi:hypothetical protein
VRANTVSPAARQRTRRRRRQRRPPRRHNRRPRQRRKPEASPASQPPPPESYTYRPDGRRDPFQNLIGSGSDKNVAVHKGDGPAGMTLGEISIRGIMQSKGALVP